MMKSEKKNINLKYLPKQIIIIIISWFDRGKNWGWNSKKKKSLSQTKAIKKWLNLKK